MKSLYLLAFMQIISDNIYGFKPSKSIQKQSKSIFSNKKYTETITPARYNPGNHIKYDNSDTDNFMPKHYFPDVEYPINILEASKPFYVITGENNAFLTPFSDDVKTNFNSAPIKPATGKVKPEIFNENKLKSSTPKNMAYKSIGPENRYSTVTKTTVVHENNIPETAPNKTHLDSPIIDEPVTSQLEKPAVKENVQPEIMISHESDSQEYYEYEEPDTDTNDTVFDDEVEVFYSDEFFNDATFENASVSEDATAGNNYTPEHSTVERSEVPVNSTTLVEPNTCLSKDCTKPVEENNTKLNTSFVQKNPKKIGLGPVQNVKQRKFLKFMNRKPTEEIIKKPYKFISKG